ncbi:MAG: hypothetical protein KDG54_08200 [Geminicoccaceae bacterium]|nr:hypothetical protein [Geminicoccaceae bacterium]
MDILAIALVTSIVLSTLLMTSVLARTGLRGRVRLVPIGLILGVLSGLLEFYWAIEDNPLIVRIGYLPAQILVIACARAMLYGLLTGSAIVLTLGRVEKTNRRADVMTIGIAVGFGFGMATTFVGLTEGLGWPPGQLIIATVNLPMQICFGILLASTVLVSRFGTPSSHRIALSYLLALVIQAAYQAVLITNDTIGYWLAWLQPVTLGFIWIGLIMLIWLVGIAVMNAQQRADLPGEQMLELRRQQSRMILNPVTWFMIGLLVVLSTFWLVYMAVQANLDTALGRVMIYTVLATPLLCAAVILRTAHQLRRKPVVAR